MLSFPVTHRQATGRKTLRAFTSAAPSPVHIPTSITS